MAQSPNRFGFDRSNSRNAPRQQRRLPRTVWPVAGPNGNPPTVSADNPDRNRPAASSHAIEHFIGGTVIPGQPTSPENQPGPDVPPTDNTDQNPNAGGDKPS